MGVRRAREHITKPRPLAVIRNRRLNSVALLAPPPSVQFSSVQFSSAPYIWLSFVGYFFFSSIIIFKVQLHTGFETS